MSDSDIEIIQEQTAAVSDDKACDVLIRKCDEELQAAAQDLNEARILAARAGLSVDTSILDPSFPTLVVGNTSNDTPEGVATTATVLRTTGGHSNTDHILVHTGDLRADRIAELKRAMRRRARTSQPENKGEDRWDQPRLPGVRRRRIQRDKDLPSAPPEPPQTGYVVFVGQMTTKIRHDRPHEPHNQAKVIHEISKIWRLGMSDAEREYYNEFAREAREEYQREHREFRATGSYKPSHIFEKMAGVGPWVRVDWEARNTLEREISGYSTVQFPPRPPELDDEHNKRVEERKRRRQQKEAATKKSRMH